MDRRRLLLANSHNSGGGVDLSFTARFYTDYCDDMGWTKSCYRAADELSLQFYGILTQLLDKYGTQGEVLTYLNDITQYGVEVYIDDILCIDITKINEAPGIDITADDFRFGAYIDTDGSMSYDYQVI